MASWDGIVDPAGSFTVRDAAPVLYRADGTPLKRQIGFCMQSSGTFPGLSDGTGTKRKPPKKGGKK